jgi:alkylation response protein AidB-like acyl-CoA dehydrogenase
VENEIPDLNEYRENARAWVAQNLEPRVESSIVSVGVRAHRTVEEVAAERALKRRLYEAGYSGITWPKACGGQGLPQAYERAFNEEASGYRLPDLGVAGGTSIICARTMLAHASPEFLARHIPRILAGDELWVQFFSEPGAGSDLAGIVTRAERDGDRWILNGSKIWSSGAYYADYGMCLARTNWDVPKHRGLTWFAVPTSAPGVTVEPIRMIIGEAEFCQEFFDDVELTDDDIIGEVDQGWPVAQTMLVFERSGGVTDSAALEDDGGGFAPDLVALARRLGKTGDPTVRQLIGQAHVNDTVERLLRQRIIDVVGSGIANGAGFAAYGKLGAGLFGAERARLGMQIGGGSAIAWASGDDEGMSPAVDYLLGRIRAIAGGTNEMQRNAIGERVLGLPREPAVDVDKPFREVAHNAGAASRSA